jgi:Protein of unknown function (DUF1553)/Protein of unknown function (DUF1549)/Planctomycete cytochrome C
VEGRGQSDILTENWSSGIREAEKCRSSFNPTFRINKVPIQFLIFICGTLLPGSLDDRVHFGRDVLPILSNTCFACHGPDAAQRDSELRLDVATSVFADLGGYHAVVPGDPEQSELFRRIVHEDADTRMPPEETVPQLTKHDIDVIRKWIEQGAEWETHWAFVSPKKPALPVSENAVPPPNGIDRFATARLATEGLQLSAEAAKTTLIRRVTLDLTGLPPTLPEIDAFLADAGDDAWEKVVDRLLQSPRYGEHMAVAWLDAARYADTDGYQNDRIRYQWVWRDWVIKAFNDNMPFDQFTIEQLAGDLLPNPTFRQQVATGFNRNHRINSEGGSIPEEWLVEYVVDRVDTLGTVWLGLTVQCARCHDHKYDPISQKEYYQLFATLHQNDEWGLGPNNGNSPPFVTVPKSWPDLTAKQNIAQPPETPTIKVTQTSVPRPQPGGPDTVMVMHERDDPRTTYLLKRGVYNQPDTSEKLRPDVPVSLGRWPADTARNRLGLAKWLVDPSHPLTARVTVNRIWQSLFGTGIVRTSEDFGIQGEAPSHPELLDWLAVTFVENGWDVKDLYRLIVTSHTYRQSSGTTPELLERDPDNRLLSRGPRVRLSAQVTRDLALFVSGLLVEKVGGPSVHPYMPPGIWSSMSNNKYKQDHGESLYRRSMYTYWRRTIPPPTMMAFNAVDRDLCQVRKPRIITPQQALALMNNITFVEAARCMAERVLQEGGESDDSRLSFGFRLSTGEFPGDEDLVLLSDALDTFRRDFRSQPKRAASLLTVGEAPRNDKLDVIEVASYAMVANLLLNLDQTVTKE